VVVGLSVCYDLRFPEPYRIMALMGATVLMVPAAFTAVTGPAHWELLLRARAVENGVWVVGCGQVGVLPPGMPPCHGHTMVVDPWGTVVAERTEPSPGVVLAEASMAQVARVRSQLPVLAHRRPGAYRWPDDIRRGTVGGDG
jgi:nitrilase